jgi:UDP-galactopyranose mutase
LGYVNKTHVPVPVNIDTVNLLFHSNIQSTEEMDKWLKKEQVHYDHEPVNVEEIAMRCVGKRLYELIFKGYMLKQVTARIPIRNDWDD